MRQSQKHKCPMQSTCKPSYMKICEEGSGEGALSLSIFTVSEILRKGAFMFVCKEHQKI